MKPKLTILALSILCYLCSMLPCHAQLGTKLKKFNEYSETALDFLDEYTDTRSSCLAMGLSEAKCNEAAAICATFDFATGNVPGLLADFFRELQLFDVFKPRCGDDECFQCCYAGGNCHTSFIGYPVLNCNTNYGADARAAGITIITGGEPGDACLFTPQTCDHVAICHYDRSTEAINNINNDPNHILKSQAAQEQKLLQYGSDLLDVLIEDFLNNVNIGSNLSQSLVPAGFDPNASRNSNGLGDIILENYSFTDYYNLLTSRGSPYWREWVDNLSTINLDNEAFGIYDDTTGDFLPAPSKYNFVRQILFARTLASLPNQIDRLNYTGSFIWADDALDDYVSTIGDPTAVLDQQMTPLAEYFYRNNPKNQDFRLLTVPLQGEEDLTHFYGGSNVGKPPVIQTNWTELTNNEIELTASIFSPGTHADIYNFDGTIYWGDGTATDFVMSDILDTKSIKHVYPEMGQYQAVTILQNSSGLRCFKMDALALTTNVSNQPAEFPILNEISIASTSLSTGVFTNTEQIGIDILIGDSASQLLSGRIVPQTLNNNAFELYYDINIHNYSLMDIDTIFFRPLLINDDGGTFTSSLFMFTDPQGKIYNPATDEDVIVSMPVDLTTIRLYDANGGLINDPELIIYNPSNSRTGVYIEDDDIDVALIAIPIDKALLAANYLTPSSTPLTNNATFLEMKPNLFEEYQLPNCDITAANMSPQTTVSHDVEIITNGSVESPESIALIAENNVQLLENFCVNIGGEFLADIGICMQSGPALRSAAASTQPTDVLFRMPDKLVDEATSFYFYLPTDDAEVSLTLYSMMNPDQKTSIIDQATYPKGHHQYRFNKNKLVGGNYRLEFKVNDDVKKSMILKVLDPVR